MEKLENVQKEIVTINSENIINRALNSNFLSITNLRLHVGGPVRVYREERKRCEGPFSIPRMEKKHVWIAEGDRVKPCCIICVINAVIRGKDQDLDHLLTSHQTFETVRNQITELLNPSDPRWYFPIRYVAMKHK